MTRKPTSRARLDRDAVVRAASALVNTEGAEALTLNRLARELNIRPPSLYNHIENLEGLWHELSILNATILGDRITSASIGKSGPEGIRALASAYRAHIQEYPALYQASLRASGKKENPDNRLQVAEERVVQAALAMVKSFDLTGVEALHAVRMLRSMVHGFATLEVAGGFGLPLSLDESFDRLIEITILGLQNIDTGLH